MCYPDLLIRGISSLNCLDEDDLPSSVLFPFDKAESVRLPGYREESINWYDSADAVSLTFNQTKDDGTIQFKVGIAVLFRNELDRIRDNPQVRQRFNYERHQVAGNPYHGNMLLKMDTPKPLKRRIQAQLALNVTKIIKREDYERQ